MDRLDAGRVIVLLTTAFPTYPVDEATSELYVSALADKVMDPVVGYAAVQDWILGRLTFPKVAELLDECTAEAERRAKRAAAIERGRKGAAAEGLESCTACHGSGLEWHDIDAEVKKRHESYAALQAVLPCRACKPVLHKHWAEGHVAPEHDFLACEWPMCKARAERGEKRSKVGAAKGEQRGAAPVDRRYEKQSDDVGPGF